ncbi:solute carrier family 67 member A1 isoform X2 [Petromyzon marinus]|uniref:Solute carrier family 22 member 18 isoform X2 n=1 Tax=Petromyzon marinus TaxID=7757 RepID=A0AAJ7TDI4_PETMA|nr:solute carrier family 22 member 18 isoform X2 [Petromyzon marinus]
MEKRAEMSAERGRSVVRTVHLTTAIYACCFWIQLGVLPYLSRKLDVDAVQFGTLQTFFAVVQLLGGSFFGRFGDVFGGRAALSVAYLSAAFAHLLLGLSSSVPLLFISRLPSMFMHGFQGAQMVVTDLSDKSQRADALGKIGVLYGVGMISGSMLGGLLTSHYSEETAAFVAAAGCLACCALAVARVPRHTKSPAVLAKEDKDESTGIFNVQKIVQLLKIPGTLQIFTIKTITGLPVGIFHSMFSLLTMEYFKLQPEQNGYLMSYIGLLQMAMMTSVFHFCLNAIPMSLGLGMTMVMSDSLLTKVVPPANTGVMLGLSMSIHSLVRTVSPTIGGFLYASFGFPVFGWLQFVVNLALFVSLHIYIRSKSKAAAIFTSKQ